MDYKKKSELEKIFSPLNETQKLYLKESQIITNNKINEVNNALIDRITKLRDGKLNEDYLKKASEIIQSKTKISKKDLPNLLLTLEAMNWSNEFYPLKIISNAPSNIYIFGSSQNTKWYNDIDILTDSARAISNLKSFKSQFDQINFKELFENFGGGYDGFLEHGEYLLTLPNGNWNNLFKTKLNLTLAEKEDKNLPRDFKKTPILFRK